MGLIFFHKSKIEVQISLGNLFKDTAKVLSTVKLKFFPLHYATS